ncbi:MAG TPA: hypothetical protein VK870_09220 [Ignavibacteriaceae bacterium]|nr:hypothetical protein [Ignavibacteriaceae bacterium]
MNEIKIKSTSKSKINLADCRLKTVDSRHILRFAYCLLSIAYLPYILMTLMFLLTFTIELHPTIRYVSTTGNNIPPYLTWEDAANVIQDAINICELGDTVLVDNGTYYENLVINTSISLIGLSMDSTIIDGRGLGDFTILNNEPLKIENFNIIGKGENTVGTRCIQFYNFLEIKNCKIIETELGLGSVGSDIVAESVLMDKIKGGFSLFGNSNNYISKCIVLLNQQNSIGIGVGFAPNGTYFITNNIIIFTGTNPQGTRIGISVGAPGSVHIYNNLISGFGAIYFDTVIDTAFVKNNVLIHGAGISSSGNKVYTNNLALANNYFGIDQIGGGFIDSDYNLFWNNVFDFFNTTNYGDSDIVADPMFIKDTLPNPQLDFDYHLQAFSPGIDAGDPNILDVDDSRSDIGLYGGPLGQSYKYQDLPPNAPGNFSAVLDTNQILLKWNRNSEADTSHYKVYRDTVSNFIVDPTKLISSQTDTFIIQQPPYQSSQYVYKITCVDNQENESLPSEEIVIKPTSVDEYPVVINDYILYQNYPNPFNPSTKIGYKLKDRGYVKLMVYDITGSLVSVLVNKEQEAGYYEVEFNVGNGLPSVPNSSVLSSGIYLYRIEIIGEGRIPKFSDMKKMVYIK